MIADIDKIKLELNETLVLDALNQFWLVTSGSVDIYTVDIDDNGEYRSVLNYLYRAKKGELISSLLMNFEDSSNLKLIVKSSGASLLAIKKDELLQINHVFLEEMINTWLLKLIKYLKEKPSSRIYLPLDSYGEHLLSNQSIAYPTKGLVWVKLIHGDLKSSYSRDLNTQDVFFPISNHFHLEVESKTAKVSVISTNEIIKEGEFFLRCLDFLQKEFYNELILKKSKTLLDEEELILKKENNEEKNMHNALESLQNIVSNVDSIGKKEVFEKTKTFEKTDYLIDACRVIGNATGFEFKVPQFIQTYKGSISQQLYTIAQTSKLRIRKVILRGNWWKEENGNILAFFKEDKRPVALIQKTSNSYILHDVELNEYYNVDNEIADKLEPISYMFFHGFHNNISGLKELGSYIIHGVKKDITFLLLATFIISLLGLLTPVLSGIMFDDVIPSADKTLHVEIFLIMVFMAIISACLQLIQGIMQLRLETKSSTHLQAGVMDHLLRLPITFYKKYTAGDLTNRALSVNSIRQILSNTVLTALLSGTFSFINLLLLFYYDIDLAWIGVGLALVAVGFVLVIGLIKLKFDRKISNEEGVLQGFLFEFLSGISKIRITGGERRVFGLWITKFSHLKKMKFTSNFYENFVYTFNSSYPILTNILFFAFIYYTVTTSHIPLISVGIFMAFISAFNQFLNDTLKMSNALITSLNVVTLYERVKPILEEKSESVEDSLDPGELIGDIEMNSVSFRYDEDQPLILNDVSFKIKSGEMVAFVGASGSGKSTIMRLLLGFESPEVGSIYYDGSAYDSMNKDLVRKQIGTVLQNGTLMSGSIYKNIVGNSELTLEDAWEAAKMSGLEEDIKQMPMEMHTVISEGAGTFSGGQRQRLMIARAVAYKPRILFMDEATSALDNKTQDIVTESLDKLQATRIIIAHRLSTIKNADCIYVLDKGKIVESGSYEKLIKQEGAFSELVKRQMV